MCVYVCVCVSVVDVHVCERDVNDTGRCYSLNAVHCFVTPQGWPKWASMVVYSTSDGGAAIGLYAPSVSTLPDGSTVDIDTSYPYEDEVRITVVAKSAMPLYVRIPAWATTGTTVNGVSVANGTMYKVACTAGSNSVKVVFAPEITVQRWGDEPLDGNTGPVSVHRGPLLFSLPIDGNYTVRTPSPSCCWRVLLLSRKNCRCCCSDYDW